MKISPQLAVMIGAAAVSGVTITIILLRSLQATPEKRERKRRLEVNRSGRLADAFITDATVDTIYYEYSVQGVQYTASQDISALSAHLPVAAEKLIGVASLKYAHNNPANSILVCEEWSGLRRPSRMAG
jgi:hypothetical protein